MMEREKAFGIRLGLALALSLLGASAAQGRDWVDFTVAGCKVEADDPPLTNFPVAVRISAARIKGFRYSDIASPDDLLFSSTESKAPYPFEVETWNPDGESVVWVRLPLVCTNTQFRMSFNLPPNRPANPDSTNVWSAANYRGVWHMADDFDLSAGQSDSSGNGFTATYASGASDGSISATGGVIGKGFSKAFGKTSSGDCITTPNLKSPIKMNWDGCTLSGWSYWKGFTATGKHWFFEVNTSISSYYWGLHVSNTRVGSKFSTGSSNSLGISPASGWYHWAIKVTGKRNFTFFINGNMVRTEVEAGYGGDNQFTQGATTSLWRCGGNTGYLDEYRYRNAASSDDWIRAEYDSVKNKDFVIAGPVHRGGKLILYVQ